MKIATISHSHVAFRQQLFFKEVAKQGHDVLMISPGEWGDLRTLWGYAEFVYNPDTNMGPRVFGRWKLETCRHMWGDNIYTYKLLGAKDLVEAFDPDWLYVQAEPGSLTAAEALDWRAKKRAIFTWENIHKFKNKPMACEVLGRYDLVVCGNPEAVEVVKPCNPNTFLMLQVGVDTDHFEARPTVERDIEVAYVGRVAPEKGLPYVQRAWPTVQVLEWKDFKVLPWWYSQVKTIMAFSQDVPFWREQAPNYVALEALCCGCKVVVSDTAAMKYWLQGCPGVVVVEGHDQPDGDLRLGRIEELRKGIQQALDMEVTEASRQWVVDRFSNPVTAKKLLEVLSEQF